MISKEKIAKTATILDFSEDTWINEWLFVLYYEQIKKNMIFSFYSILQHSFLHG